MITETQDLSQKVARLAARYDTSLSGMDEPAGGEMAVGGSGHAAAGGAVARADGETIRPAAETNLPVAEPAGGVTVPAGGIIGVGTEVPISNTDTVSGADIEGALASRIAHLDASAQATIIELSRLQRDHAVRCWESCDGLAAGIIAGRTIRRQRPEVVRRAWELFFGPHHVTICTLFEAELLAVARREGKAAAWPAPGGWRG